MANITLQEVHETAALAQLALSTEECEHMQTDLDAILGVMQVLKTIDVTAISSSVNEVKLACPLRDDEVAGELTPDAALAAAPARQENFFVVPRIILHDKEAL